MTSEWTGGEPDAPNEDYLELLELIEAMPKPAISVLVDVGSRPGRSGIAGDGMMREFQVLGAAGAIVAGSIIDIAGMEQLSFPVYANGSCRRTTTCGWAGSADRWTSGRCGSRPATCSSPTGPACCACPSMQPMP